MMNGRAELTDEQEMRLVVCYVALRALADTCEVPAILAAVQASLVELDVALAGQDLDPESIAHPWAVLRAG